MYLKLSSLLVVILFFLTVSGEEELRQPRRRYEDPFSLLDREMSHALAAEHALMLARQFFFPWSTLAKAATALDEEDDVEEPNVNIDSKKFEVVINVRHFKPEEIKVKVKNGFVLVEGKHMESSGDNKKAFVGSHFVQRFALPPGTKADEVTAVRNEKGVLVISAPKHQLPPPPPEREVPIEIRKPTIEQQTTERVTEATEAKEENISTLPPTERVEIEEEKATTHIGKIRKKELKIEPKDVKKVEPTTKSNMDNNVLDYAFVENE